MLNRPRGKSSLLLSLCPSQVDTLHPPPTLPQESSGDTQLLLCPFPQWLTGFEHHSLPASSEEQLLFKATMIHTWALVSSVYAKMMSSLDLFCWKQGVLQDAAQRPPPLGSPPYQGKACSLVRAHQTAMLWEASGLGSSPRAWDMLSQQQLEPMVVGSTEWAVPAFLLTCPLGVRGSWLTPTMYL